MSYFKRPLFWLLSLASTAAFLLLVTITQSPVAQGNVPSLTTANEIQQRLPSAMAHPLPEGLMDWADRDEDGSYFDQIQPTAFGYLVWSQFPVRVYLEPHSLEAAMGDRPPTPQPHHETWLTAVQTAIEEWNHYIPLEQTMSPDEADITIVAQAPPLSWGEGSPRAQTAETTYTLNVVTLADGQQFLQPRYQILLSPNQSDRYTIATARHELGHALGIWGHSLSEADALYYAQVRNPVSISPRDVNTLKQIYQQPTQLGWPLSNPTDFLSH